MGKSWWYNVNAEIEMIVIKIKIKLVLIFKLDDAKILGIIKKTENGFQKRI